MKARAGCVFAVSTPHEGVWAFTASECADDAWVAFVNALKVRAILSMPINNPPVIGLYSIATLAELAKEGKP